MSDNKLLATLSRAERARLAPALKEQYLELKQVLYEPGEPIKHVYFPLAGMCSLLTVLTDGSAIEVATVGNEGMVGVGAFLGSDSHLWRALSQIPGHVLRMRVNDFKDELGNDGRLLRMVRRYTHALIAKVARSAACNRLHSTEQRCCKWLLLTHDRVMVDEFPITHEFLAQMLGVRRAGVSEVAATLQRSGLIRYKRGKITILDRARLEAASCECYRAVRNEFDRLNSTA